MHNNTLGEVVTRVIKAKLGFNEPSITMGSCFLYEEGEGADEDLVENLTLKLSACPAGGVVNGTQLVIEDFTQNLEVSKRSANLKCCFSTKESAPWFLITFNYCDSFCAVS